MKRRLLILAAALLSISVALGLFIYLNNQEPMYEGRPLSEWVADLQSNDSKRYRKAVEVLRAMGPEAVSALEERLGAKENFFERSSRKVSEYVPERAKNLLRKVVKGRHERMMAQVGAAKALQTIGTNAHGAAPELGRMLNGPDTYLSSVAGTALGHLGPAGVPVLVAALDHTNYTVRANACNALGSLGTNAAPAADRLCELVEAESGPLASTSAYTLSRIGPPVVPQVVKLLQSTNWTVRRWGAYALTHMRVPPVEAVPELTALLKDENDTVRLAAVNALGNISLVSRPVGELLMGAIDDSDPEVRKAAVLGAGMRPSNVLDHLAAFMALLQDPLPAIRLRAAYAIGQTGHRGKEAIPALEALLKDSEPAVVRNAEIALDTIRQSEEIVQKRAAAGN